MSRLTLGTGCPESSYGYGGFTLYATAFQPLPLELSFVCRPEPQLALVWAVPLSLATTDGIDLSFFSSRYFDVSVPWVAFRIL